MVSRSGHKKGYKTKISTVITIRITESHHYSVAQADWPLIPAANEFACLTFK